MVKCPTEQKRYCAAVGVKYYTREKDNRKIAEFLHELFKGDLNKEVSELMEKVDKIVKEAGKERGLELESDMPMWRKQK